MNHRGAAAPRDPPLKAAVTDGRQAGPALELADFKRAFGRFRRDQITDNAANSDATKAGPRHQTGALYDLFPPLKDATRPVGEFNHSRIVAKGDHIEHWVNG